MIPTRLATQQLDPTTGGESNDVENVDGMAERAVNGGGTLVVPKMAVPGVGWLVYCKDTEGNIFGMLQMDAGAK